MHKNAIVWFRLELLHLLVATSTLNQEEKSEVKHTVESLGGKLASDWRRECTHLTMNKLTVTVKVSHLQVLWIVTDHASIVD